MRRSREQLKYLYQAWEELLNYSQHFEDEDKKVIEAMRSLGSVLDKKVKEYYAKSVGAKP